MDPLVKPEEALEEVNFSHLPFGHLSTGQRRRVAICRMMINSRPLWLLDEPTSGLDAASDNALPKSCGIIWKAWA
ncbi:MAG: ATP-binding cassette domain-containing protein [Xanthomonadales bacterium]|nr:ATP-binding cassette domain-containing protein [Xanthomonadales bacterium]